MNKDKRDISILRKIVKYCDEIAETIAYFGNSYDLLIGNKIYQNAASMCVLQIGELAGHLSENFRLAHPEMPWQDMKGMRNLAAHEYEKIQPDFLWDTMSSDIPALRDYCLQIIERTSTSV